MTTAAKPTYVPARGGTGKSENDLGALSKQYSSRDLPAHTKLKYRQDGQNTSSDLKSRDFRKELEDKERSGRDKTRGGDRARESGSSAAASSSSSASSSKKPRLDQLPAANLDADDPVDDDDDDDEKSDDDDDTAELLAELAKIKKERAAEATQKEMERKAEEERIRMENIIKGNPLINQQDKAPAEFKVKRRWDDDVVFKNCTRGESDKKERRFINDTLRSEFHKKFMEKYIK